LQRGRIVEATVVHHKRPHHGDLDLFFDPANLESLCAPHHDSHAQQEERLGYSCEIGADGYYLDPLHPSNRTY
jgi:hypothetical protein